MTAAVAKAGDAELLRALRRGDENAFDILVRRHHASLVRLAATYVRSRAAAEDVAQETWLAVLRGLDGFRGECALTTWVFRILANIAKTRALREQRSVPLSSLGDEPTVDPDRFFARGAAAGHWSRPPASWSPEERLESRETMASVAQAIAALPDAQRRVITLRDVEGWSAAEVCELLAISEVNQRVLLHRARSRVRAALEAHFTSVYAEAR
jgi:RNA polymerase sigma-70 factor (ECF subfamily)